MARKRADCNPIETGTVTAELALPHDAWPRELRGICARLDRAPAAALTAMAVRIRLRAPAAPLARQYGLRPAGAGDGATCTIRPSRPAGAGETTGGDDERP